MATYRRMTIAEFASSINGGVDVKEMYLTDMRYKVKPRNVRRIFNINGRLTYYTDSGNPAFVQSGDILYLKNGDTVEVV